MAVTLRKVDASGVEMFPDWLVAATPGAPEAYAAWQEARAESAPLIAAERVAIAEAAGLGRWTGPNGDATYGPRPGVSTADFEAAQAKKAEAQAASKAHGRRAALARRRFEDLMASGLDPEQKRRLAAGVAVDAQAEAAAAWAALSDALARRDEAYRLAGSPGRPWHTSQGAPASPSAARGQAEHLFGVIVGGFDADAVRAVAGGEDLAALPTLEAEAQAAADRSNDRAAASARSRSAKGF